MMGQSEYRPARRQPRRQQDHPGHHHRDHRRGRLDRAPERAHARAPAAPIYEHYGVHPELHDPRRLLRGAERGAAPPSTSAPSWARAAFATGDRRGRPPAHGRGARSDEGRGGAGHGGGRARPLDLAHLRARTASPRPRRSSPSPRSRRRYGGSYITHQRDEGDDAAVGLDASMDEVFRIAREAQIPAEIYHLKASGKRNWGRMPALLKRIEEARAEGLDVSADQYPWTASSNDLDASLPVWVREGGAREAWWRASRDPATRARARADFLKLPENPDWPARRRAHPRDERPEPALKKYEGQTIEQIAQATGQGPARRAHGHRDRRPGQHRAGHLRDERGRRARGAAAPARLLLHRLRARRRGRHLLEGEVAPAGLGLGRAHPRPLRARGEGPERSRRRCAR